jgi:transposase
VTCERLDVVDSRSVKDCARRLTEAGTEVNVPVNNAGVYPTQGVFSVSEETFEMALQAGTGGCATRLWGAGYLVKYLRHGVRFGWTVYLVSPTDRAKPGSKRHLVIDRNGIPRAVLLTEANLHDSRVVEDLLDGIEPLKGARGRPRRRPEKLHADKGYDARACREVLKRRGIKSRIARKGKESSERLGRHRWVVESALAWMARYRRLAVRYERRAKIHEAFILHVGCSFICLNYLSS